MVSKAFAVGDLVWAKMKCYPPWPARIENPLSDIKPSKNKESQYVFFFGTENYAWIQDRYITPHSESVLKSFGNKKSVAFQKAVDDFITFANDPKKEGKGPLKMKKDKIQNDKDIQTKMVKDVNRVVKKRERKRSSNKSPFKTVKRSLNDINGGFGVGSSSESFKNHKCDSSDLEQDACTLEDNACHALIDDYVLDEKHIKPSPKKFGFIGLGHMGRAIVKNMIESGHDVTVWNRHSHKYSVLQRAKKAESPADLVMKCDVVFCCVSDTDASKALIFGDRGILKGLEQAEKSNQPRKAYVEMTSIDVQSSVEISEAIGMKRGLYLEAPLCGTNKDAEDGTLLIVASGDRRVFAQCETCFHAVGRHAFYLSCEVGYSTKLSLILSMLSGTICAAVAEVLVLAEKLKVPREHFLKLLRLGPLNCDGIMQKMDMMRRRTFSSYTSIQRIHKDVDLALTLADSFSQPMPVTAAANELYKLINQLGYSEQDPGALYKALHCGM